jgi:hypothetical protein
MQLQPPSSLPLTNYNLDGGKNEVNKINLREIRSSKKHIYDNPKTITRSMAY